MSLVIFASPHSCHPLDEHVVSEITTELDGKAILRDRLALSFGKEFFNKLHGDLAQKLNAPRSDPLF